VRHRRATRPRRRAAPVGHDGRLPRPRLAGVRGRLRRRRGPRRRPRGAVRRRGGGSGRDGSVRRGRRRRRRAGGRGVERDRGGVRDADRLPLRPRRDRLPRRRGAGEAERAGAPPGPPRHPAHPLHGLARRDGRRSPGRSVPAPRRPRLPAAAGEAGGRAPDVAARGGAGGGAEPVRRHPVGQAPRQPDLPAPRPPGGRRRGARAADERDPQPGAASRPRGPPPCLRGGACRLGGERAAAGGGDERDQGTGQHPHRATWLGRPARRGALRRPHRPGDARRPRRRRARGLPRAAALPEAQGPGARSAGAGLVRPLRPGRPRGSRVGLAGRHGVSARAVRRLLRPDARSGGPRRARAMDRRRAASGQTRRRLLHGAARRRVADSRQLHPLLRRRLHPCPRARPCLPQPERGGADAAPARDTDDLGGDRQHLLRDDRAGGGADPRRRAGAALHPGAVAPGFLPDRGRHPQPLRLRAARLRRPSGAGALDRRAERGHARRPARHLRRRARPRRAPPVHVGRQGALLQRRSLLLQLPVPVRAPLRPRPLRALPRGAGRVPCRLRRTPRLDRPRRRRRARPSLRDRSPRARLLAGQPRRHPGRRRPLRGADGPQGGDGVGV
ncbi:MAG: Oligoendopeptidase F, partial [uncultured Thermomicrobiales bacterium]